MIRQIPQPRLKGYRFPRSVISCAVWAYHRFALGLRDVEDLLAERGIIVSYETIRAWVGKFGAQIAKRIRSVRIQPSDKGDIFSPSDDDLGHIQERRRPENRLGFRKNGNAATRSFCDLFSYRRGEGESVSVSIQPDCPAAVSALQNRH